MDEQDISEQQMEQQLIINNQQELPPVFDHNTPQQIYQNMSYLKEISQPSQKIDFFYPQKNLSNFIFHLLFQEDDQLLHQLTCNPFRIMKYYKMTSSRKEQTEQQEQWQKMVRQTKKKLTKTHNTKICKSILPYIKQWNIKSTEGKRIAIKFGFSILTILNNQNIQQISHIKFSNLKRLDISNWGIHNLEFISYIQCPVLEHLILNQNQIVNYKPLSKTNFCKLIKIGFDDHTNSNMLLMPLNRMRLCNNTFKQFFFDTYPYQTSQIDDISLFAKIQSNGITGKIANIEIIPSRRLSLVMWFKFIATKQPFVFQSKFRRLYS